EIDLAPLDGDAGDDDLDRIADPERPARAPAAEAVLRLDVLVVVVHEGRDVDESLDEEVAELDEEAERRDARDEPLVLGADLVLHELDLLELQDLALRFHRDALAPRGMRGDLGEVGRNPHAAAERHVEETLHDEI